MDRIQADPHHAAQANVHDVKGIEDDFVIILMFILKLNVLGNGLCTKLTPKYRTCVYPLAEMHSV